MTNVIDLGLYLCPRPLPQMPKAPPKYACHECDTLIKDAWKYCPECGQWQPVLRLIKSEA